MSGLRRANAPYDTDVHDTTVLVDVGYTIFIFGLSNHRTVRRPFLRKADRKLSVAP
jgi:hypothetical protein